MADHRTKLIETTQGTAVVTAMKHREWREFAALVRAAQKQIAAGETADEIAVEDYLLKFVSLPQGADIDLLERWEILDLIEAVKNVTTEGSAKN